MKRDVPAFTYGGTNGNVWRDPIHINGSKSSGPFLLIPLREPHGVLLGYLEADEPPMNYEKAKPKTETETWKRNPRAMHLSIETETRKRNPWTMH